MVLEITDSERRVLMELVDSASKTLLQEIDHTDTRDYKKRLQDRMRILEHLSGKMKEPQEAQKTF